MRKKLTSAQILADNLRRVTGKSVRKWAGNDESLARAVSRIIAAEHSPTVEVLEAIAEKSGNLMVWHLLLPNLDPSNPPVMVMGEHERQLYKDLKESAKQLPDI